MMLIKSQGRILIVEMQRMLQGLPGHVICYELSILMLLVVILVSILASAWVRESMYSADQVVHHPSIRLC